MQKEFKVASKATLDKVKELVDNNSSGGCVTMLKLGEYVENIGGNKSISTLPYELLNGCVVVYNNEIHILGGENSKTSHYKWNGTEWTSVSTLPFDFYQGSAVVLNNEIHILGGLDNSTSDNSNTYHKKHYKWNGTEWISVSTLPYEFYSGSIVAYNGEIHILGGISSLDDKTKHYKWNGSEWTSASVIPYELQYGSVVVFNNELHLLGGYYSDTNHYKWNGSEWTEVSTLPYEFYNGSAIVFNNEIHILGGYYSNTRRYHYKWNGTSWVSVSTLPYEFYDADVALLNNEIHILSGPSSYRTNHYRILSGYYKDVELFLFKGCVIDNDNTLYPFQNCVYENGVLTITEDGIVKFGVETTENDITLVIGGGS